MAKSKPKASKLGSNPLDDMIGFDPNAPVKKGSEPETEPAKAAAAVSSIGGFMIPEMERKNYGREFSVALTTTSATTGLLIPPSNIMIVYAVVAGNVSVAGLFLGGIVPGVLMGLLIMGACFLMNRTQDVGSGEVASIKQVFVSFGQALQSVFLVIIVIGGILGGVCFQPLTHLR